MSKGDTVAKEQILQEYDNGIQALQETDLDHDVPKTCKVASPMKRGVLLMMRYHRIKIKEEIEEGKTHGKAREMVRVGLVVAGVSAAFSPQVWLLMGRVITQITK